MNKNKEKITSITSITMLLLALIPYMDNATTLDKGLTSRPNRIERSLLRQMLSLIFSMIIFISIAAPFVPVASASGGAYTLKWYAADPEVNRAPYLPTYEKLTPSQLACPGTAGRYPDPLNDSVAYGPTYNSSNLDAMTSLAPKDMALGQIVPFEVEIAVNGDTDPENGTINFTGGWDTNTTSGDEFGYDSVYMVYCAFVDTADPGTIDPGNNTKVDSFTSELANPGTKNEEIQGTFQISGLDNGDNVIVEVWVVLKPTIPSGSTGNVQSRLVSAQTVATEPDDINTGNQVIPLLRVQEFFSADADISVNKTDSPDPVTQGQYLNYTLLVKNNSPDTIANGVNVTDTLDPNTTFVSASGAPYNNTTSTVTFNVGALAPGQSVTLTINTTVSDTAPTDNDTSENPETGSETLPTISYDLLNSVSVTSITDDSNTTNNTYYQPTNVLPAFEPSATLTLLKQISNSSTGPWSSSITVPGGSPVYYNFTIINTGNVPLRSLSINDSLVNTPGITPPWPEPLEVLASASRIVGPVTAETLAGTYPNTATANGTYGNETYESGPSSAEYIVAGAPAYTIDKTVTDVAGQGSEGNVTAAGDVISYQITVNNTGNTDLTNVTVTDPLLGTLTGPTGDNAPTGVLDIGETWTFTGNYTATQADINNKGGGDGLINNTATVDSDELEPLSDSETVPIEQNPEYTIDKTVTDVAGKGPTGNVTAAGDVIEYQITVNNTGNMDLTNITVTDPLLGTLTGPTGDNPVAGVLEVGEIWVFTGNYTVTQAEINNNGGGDGLINNTATVDSDQLPPKEDTAEVLIEENPAYTIDKTVTDVAGKGQTANVTKAGDVITYQINVTNTGNVDLTNVTVNDTLIPDTNLTGPVESMNADNVLNVGETWTYTGTYTVTQADIKTSDGGDGVINNTATVDSDQLPPEEDTAQVPIAGTPSYTIDKTVTNVAGKGPTGNVTKAGDIISYQINVTNTGNIDLTNIIVNDTLISDVNLTGPTGDNAPVGVLDGGETWIFTGNYTVTQEDINNNGGGDGLINNTATVDSDQLGPDSDTAQVPIEKAPIEENPAYTINKTVTDVAGEGPSGNVTKAGDVITYQINVTNTGNVDLTNVTVTDSLIENLTDPSGDNPITGVLEVGETWIFTGNYTVTQTNINGNGGGDGDIDNKATVDSDQLSSQEDNEEVPIAGTPFYTIDKIVTDVAGKGPAGNVTAAGDMITYQIKVNNTGNVNLTNITLVDTLISDANISGPTGDNPVAGILEVGENWTFTGNYTVTQEDINNNGGGDGLINNTATVDSDQLSPKEDTADVPIEEIPIEENPTYTINKTVTDVAGKGPAANVTKAGDEISYQINVTNTGNVDLTNVTINDTLIPDANLTGPVESMNSDDVLEVGETWTYTGNYSVTQADINTSGGGDGLINNTATVDSDQLPPEEDTVQVPIEKVPIEENPAYAIDKTVTDVAGKGPAGNVTKAGDVIDYRINVTNTGNVDLTNITLVDSLIPDANLTGPTGDNAPAGVLDVGETWTYTGNYTVTQADINNNGGGDGLINNTATVDSDQLGPKSDNAEVPIAGTPSYTIDKTVTDVVGKGSAGNVTKAGEIITYQIKVNNTGNIDLTNVTVTDPLLGTLKEPTGDNPVVGVLEVGENWIFTGNYTVTQEDINSNGGGDGLINNIATVDSDQLPPKEDTAEVPIEEVPIEENPAYTINKTVTDVAGKGPTGNVTKAGDIISYRINVTNTGNVDLTNIIVNDTLISDVNLTGPTGDNAPAGVLDGGETWIFTGNYTVTQEDINNNGGGDGLINNTATVDSDQLGPKSDNAEVPIEQKLEKPDYCIYKSIIGVDKAGDCIINEAGDIIEYQIAVKNIGKGNLTNVTVKDSLITLTGPTGDNIDPGILNPGETWKYKGNYTVTQEDINTNGGGDGDIDNKATVSCNELSDENSTKEQKIVQTPDYCIYKSIIGVDQAGDCIINEAGDIIEYRIAVKNIGNVDLTGVSVSDPMITLTGPTGDEIDPGVLNPGETWKYKGNYTVTQADINNNGGGDGDIDNTVTVSSNELPDENSSVQQPIAQKLDLCIYKSIIGADRAGDCIINEAGDIIEYQIAVKNNGKGNLTNITVNDSLITLTGPTGDNIDPGMLNPGETWKYKGNYTVTQEDINTNGGGEGDIDNKATVSCNELPDENSSKKQPIVQTPDYCIYKSIIGADRAGDCIINEAGDIIEYQIAVKNIGNVDLTGISVNDTLIKLTGPTGDNIEPGVLNPGETWKYKGNYTVTQNDINSNGGGDGDIDNKATVSSNELPDENSTKEQLILLASTSTNNADITPTPTDDVDQNGDDDSGNGGSSGGGGGGGGSPEPAGNIKVKELSQAFVTNGKEAKFNFTKNVTCVVYVSFDSKKTMGKITTTVEMLKGKSTLTPDAPEGEVYDYLNIWIGSGGYATEQNIENAVVCFKVEKARMEEKGINESSITLKRYNDGKWSQLPVSLLKEDNKYLYFIAETPGFSPFAITGQTKNGLDANIRGTESESEINTSEEDTEYTESETEQKDGQSTPGFELVYGLVSLLAIFLYRKK